ncbi:uncharacterized protein LACBIDRAFT_296822, partial [Laccaria bicolor S238N-H82]
MVDYIGGFKLRDLKKRGVFVDLPRHWHVLNIGHLLAENVPVYYFWQEDNDDYPCFARLSPTILQAYHDACDTLDRSELLEGDMMGFQDDIDAIKQYDEFFQLRRTPDHTSSPSFSDIPPNATVYICDFEGWSVRLVIDDSLIEDYAGRYHFCIETDESDSYVTIWRWKPRRLDTGGGQRAGGWGPGSTTEACWGDREIRELFKAGHAPIGKARFDECGRITLVSRLGDVYEDNDISSVEADALDGTHLLPRPHWVPASHPPLLVPTPASPLNVASKWIQSMVAPSSHSGSRASSAARLSHSSGERDLRTRSASPDRGRTASRDQLPEGRAAYINDLRSLGSQYATPVSAWVSKKPLEWNVDYLDIRFLLVPDKKAQACLCYWAACSRDVSTMAEVLLKAITHGIPFSIGVKVEDFGRFKPEEVSDTDRVVGKPTCMMEPPFAYTAPGALKAYYMSRINNIIRRPHARILVGLGGPEAWLGHKWGGPELVAQFMDGPSPDVYLHRRGYIDSDDENPMFLYTDEMSPQEIDVIFGCIRSDIDRDRSLYPSRDILDDDCFFWTGEWDDHMENMFADLTKEILQGSAKFRTPGMWND